MQREICATTYYRSTQLGGTRDTACSWYPCAEDCCPCLCEKAKVSTAVVRLQQQDEMDETDETDEETLQSASPRESVRESRSWTSVGSSVAPSTPTWMQTTPRRVATPRNPPHISHWACHLTVSRSCQQNSSTGARNHERLR